MQQCFAFGIFLMLLLEVNSITQAENRALIAVHDALEIKDGSWDTLDPCQNLGVTCGEHVTELVYFNLPGGFIAEEIGELVWLFQIIIEESNLHGTIPPGVGNLTNLGILSLQSNALSGTIPDGVGKLQPFVLSLADNQLTGGIPSGIYQPAMEYLYLYRNNFDHDLPTEIGKMVNLCEWHANSANIGGTLPTEIGNLEILTYLDFAKNRLSGSLPTEVGNLNQLQSLILEKNQLGGTIPCQIGQLNLLEEIHLNGNKLTGHIPSEVGNLTFVHSFAIDANQLDGNLPAEFGQMIALVTLWLQENHLEGSIPTEFGDLSDLKNLGLFKNKLSGGIPKQLGSLQRLELLWIYNNGFEGCIPPDVGQLRTLTQFAASGNHLTCSLPSELGDMISLNSLELHDNSLNGTIPASISGLGNLTDLFLNKNNISGTIPIELSNMTGLDRLWLSDNPISCPPIDYSKWATKTDYNTFTSRTICVDGEKDVVDVLTESLPTEERNKDLYQCQVAHYCNYGWLTCDSDYYITEINLAKSNLSGDIPQLLQNLTRLETLNLANNTLLCPTPTNYADWARITDYDLYADGEFCAKFDCKIEEYDEHWQASLANDSCKYVENTKACELQCNKGKFTLTGQPKLLCDRGEFHGGKCEKYCDFEEYSQPRRLSTGGDKPCQKKVTEGSFCNVECLYPHEEVQNSHTLTCGANNKFDSPYPHCKEINFMTALAVFIALLGLGIILVIFCYYNVFRADLVLLLTIILALFDFISTSLVIDWGFNTKLGDPEQMLLLASLCLSFLLLSIVFNTVAIFYWTNGFFQLYIREHISVALISSLLAFVTPYALLIPVAKLLDTSAFSARYPPDKLQKLQIFGIVGLVLFSVPQFVLQMLLGVEAGFIWMVYFSVASSGATVVFLILRKSLECILHGISLLDKDAALRRYCALGDVEKVKNLLQNGADVNGSDKIGRTPLMYASETGQTLVFEPLQVAGAALDQADENEQTALMIACGTGHTRMAKTLLDNTADINLKDFESNSVLQIAVTQKQLDVILLLNSYIPPYAHRNKDDLTAFDLACKSPDEPLEILESIADYFTFPQTRFVEFEDLKDIEPLGSGAFGEVRKALLRIANTVDGPAYVPVVCKISHDEAGANEWQELQTLQNLPFHPNVTGLLAMCTGFDAGNVKKTAMIILLKGGGDLQSFCKKRKEVTKTERLLFFGVEIARGVKHLHDNGYKHCDLATRNVLMSYNELKDPENEKQRVSVTDFGLTRPIGIQHARDTPLPVLWCAPEMLQKVITDKATDTWALGCLLYELTGHPYRFPFTNPLGQAPRRKQHLQELLEGKKLAFSAYVIARIHQKWIDIITWCTSLEPHDRPTMDELLETLKELHLNQALEGPVEGPVEGDAVSMSSDSGAGLGSFDQYEGESSSADGQYDTYQSGSDDDYELYVPFSHDSDNSGAESFSGKEKKEHKSGDESVQIQSQSLYSSEQTVAIIPEVEQSDINLDQADVEKNKNGDDGVG